MEEKIIQELMDIVALDRQLESELGNFFISSNPRVQQIVETRRVLEIAKIKLLEILNSEK